MVISRPTASIVGRFEHLVLLAVLYAGDDAYAVPIADEIERRTGARPSRGALYTTLARLEEKGFLASMRGEPTPIRGGKARRYYHVSAYGRRALRQARNDLVTVWPGLSRVLGDAR